MKKNNVEEKTFKDMRMKGVRSMKIETSVKQYDMEKVTPEEILNGSNRTIKFECDCGSEFFVEFMSFIESKIQYEKK